jgi:hypothetical protein
MNKTLNGLLKSRKFWLTVFALAQTIFFHYVPDFPKEVWQAIDALVIVLILAIALEDAGKKIGNGKNGP